MQSRRFIAAFAAFAGLAGLAALAVAMVAVSSKSAPVAELGRPILAEAVPVVDYERKGPEYLSPLPQMQMLTCFGHCGAECMVSVLKPARVSCMANRGQSAQSGMYPRLL
jgi:hypothetical protein